MLLLLILLSLIAPLTAKLDFGNVHSGIVIGEGGKLVVSGNLESSGRIVLEDGATIDAADANSKITFVNGGTLEKDGVEMELVGEYALDDVITLDGNKTLEVVHGEVPYSIAVEGSGNTILGSPTFSSPIVFDDQAPAELTMQMRTVLNQVIQLNSGTLKLANELTLANGVQPVGPGAISTQGYPLIFNSSLLTMTNQLALNDNSYVVFNGDCKLQNAITINGKVSINMNGHTLDMSHADAKFTIADGAELVLTDTTLKQMKNTTFEFATTTSKLTLSGVNITLNQTATYTQGIVTITGDSSVLMGDYQWLFTSNALLVVDGAVLEFDSNNNSLVDDNSETYQLLSGGRIRDVSDPGEQSNYLTINTDTNLNLDFVLKAGAPMQFLYDAVADDTDIFVNYGGHSITFTSGGDTLLRVGAGVSAAISTVRIYNFFFESITYIDTGRFAAAGNTLFKLGGNSVLTKKVSFMSTNNIIDGLGYELDMSHNDAQLEVAENAQLILKNITLKGMKASKIHELASNTNIEFDNVRIELADNDTWSEAQYTVKNTVTVTGAKTLTLASDNSTIIASGGQLVIAGGATLAYASSDGAVDNLVFGATTSELVLDTGTLSAPASGLTLTGGVLRVRNAGTLTSAATSADNALKLGDGLESANNMRIIVPDYITLKVTGGGYVTLNEAS